MLNTVTAIGVLLLLLLLRQRIARSRPRHPPSWGEGKRIGVGFFFFDTTVFDQPSPPCTKGKYREKIGKESQNGAIFIRTNSYFEILYCLFLYGAKQVNRANRLTIIYIKIQRSGNIQQTFQRHVGCVSFQRSSENATPRYERFLKSLSTP